MYIQANEDIDNALNEDAYIVYMYANAFFLKQESFIGITP